MSGFFSKERSLERKHNKLSKRLSNMFSQSPDRRYVAQQLAELGTHEAIDILLNRFEKNTNNHTVDREEKAEILEHLVRLGEVITEPCIAHLKKPKTLHVNYPLRSLQGVLESKDLIVLLIELLDAEDIDYTRSPERKEELILTAKDYTDEALGRALVRMLEDDNENIRYLTADALIRDDYPFAAPDVMKRLTGEEESVRISTHILELVAETDFTVKGFRGAIEENLPEGYALTRAGTIRRRG